jgi:hypothetical protein
MRTQGEYLRPGEQEKRGRTIDAIEMLVGSLGGAWEKVHLPPSAPNVDFMRANGHEVRLLGTYHTNPMFAGLT